MGGAPDMGGIRSGAPSGQFRSGPSGQFSGGQWSGRQFSGQRHFRHFRHRPGFAFGFSDYGYYPYAGYDDCFRWRRVHLRGGGWRWVRINVCDYY